MRESKFKIGDIVYYHTSHRINKLMVVSIRGCETDKDTCIEYTCSHGKDLLSFTISEGLLFKTKKELLKYYEDNADD